MTVRRLTHWLRTSEARDEGAILLLAAFLMVLIFAVAALAIDITSKSQDRSDLWATSDAAALAGASQLPDFPGNAKSEALKYALANDPSLAGGVDPTFRCVVGDRDGDGQPDPSDIPVACNPGPPSPPAPPTLTGFICADGVCAARCYPDLGHKCNTIVLETEKTTDYAFAPVIGIDSGDTNVLSAACRGTCGAGATGPVDLILVLDRTGSMTSKDMQQAKDASLAVLDFFDPAIQHVGLAVLPAADPINRCKNASKDASGIWLAVPLSSDYKDNPDLDINGDGISDLDSSSALVSTIRCSTDRGRTDLGSPISDSTYFNSDALTQLLGAGRPGVKKGILLLSDGGANMPYSNPNPCLYARQRADFAKSKGVEIFTVGFGVEDGQKCNSDKDAPFAGKPVTQLLANMATQPSGDDCSVATTDIENNDGDHFFCLPKSEDLSTVFLAIATQFAQGSRLVQLPPGS